MGKKIIIDPVTRVEGHGRVTVHLDDHNEVSEARFHIVEFRGFERFIQGHPYWEVPALVQRLCGICPVSHHLAAAKAVDRLEGLDPEDLSPTADKIRRLLHYGQIFQSHALHFFYLAAPDLLFGLDAPVEQRNVAAVAIANKELARKGILMRKFGQEIIRVIAGKRIHGIAAVPGGVYKSMTAEERDYFLDGQELPSVDQMIEWSLEVLAFIKDYHEKNAGWLDVFAAYPSGHMGLVNADGALELYHGRLRAIDAQGNITLKDAPDEHYRRYFSEGVERWTYLKFPYLTHLGRDKGWNRVGPLARINVCDYITTPLAEQERQDFKAYSGAMPNNRTMFYHWARLIELLHCAEIVRDLLHDPDILGSDLVRTGQRRSEGIGVVEAPRGTLIHHYEANERGKLTRCNLIVSTTHNNEAMNRAVREVARQSMGGHPTITDAMLNQVEVAIRAYDPCLSCATHAIGQMPLQVSLINAQGETIDERLRS
ncbi:MAG: Ni/Fe hydrogenase subunit alpha [Saprospiraceae bacterium]|nr:Ni/Fe hydrogenase subunit alpha [Saprospiraceae bacterium]